MYTTGNKAVDQIGQMHLEGNVIPHKWYDHIRLENGKPDLLGIVLLAEIIYWHRPTFIRDESTGNVKAVKKKFKADFLQRNYDSFAEQFGFTKRQVQDAMTRLEKLGAVKRHFRTITVSNVRMNNVLFLELFPDTIHKFTFGDTYHVKTGQVSHYNVPPITPERGTNTEITTKITTDSNYVDNDDCASQKNSQTEIALTAKKETAYSFYESNGFGALASYVIDKIGNWIDDLSEELVIHAMKLAIENNALNWKYVETILKNWFNKKFKTIAQVEADQLRFEAEKNQKAARPQNQRKETGRNEHVPDWFEKRNEQQAQAQSTAPVDFEAERKRVLEKLGGGNQ